MFRSRQIDYFRYLVDDRYTGKNRSKSIISVNRNNEVINDFQILYGVSFGEKNVGDIFFCHMTPSKVSNYLFIVYIEWNVIGRW